MCGSKAAEVVTTVATGGMAQPIYYIPKRTMDKQENLQRDALNAQKNRDAEMIKKQEAIGAGVRKFDHAQEDISDEERKRQLALQSGILGTIKTDSNTLAAAPVQTQKATLGT